MWRVDWRDVWKSCSRFTLVVVFAFAVFAMICGLAEKVAQGADFTGSAKSLVRIEQNYPPSPNGIVESYKASGVCVSPDGLVLTNWHTTKEPLPVEVKFPDIAKLEGEILYQDKSLDVAVLKVDADQPLPYRPLAVSRPQVGESVWFEGFPYAKYQCLEGKVKRYSGSTLHTTYRVGFGGSGGPIINSKGEVVAIVHGVYNLDKDPSLPYHETLCCGLTSLQQSIKYCGAKGLRKIGNKADKSLPKAYCIWDKDCAPCLVFAADYGGKNQGKHPPRSPQLREFIDSICRLHFVEVNNAKKMCRKYGVTQKPAFLISCCEKPLVGYTTPEDFINRVKKMAETETRLGRMTTATEFPMGVGPDNLVQCQQDAFFNDDPDFFATDIQDDGTLAQTQPERRGIWPFRRQVEVKTPSQTPQPNSQRAPPQPAPQPEEVPDEELEGTPMESKESPEPTPTGDLSEVTAVVLVKKSVSGIAGKAVGFVEEHATGKLTEAINSALSDKATVRIIFERSNPTKYAAILEAAGLSGESLGEIVLVAPKKFDGLAGNLMGMVESKLEGLKHSALKKLPVSAVFERTEEDSYAAVVEALGVEGGSSAGDPGGLSLSNPFTWIHMVQFSLIGAMIALLRRVLGENNKLVLAISKLQGEKK